MNMKSKVLYLFIVTLIFAVLYFFVFIKSKSIGNSSVVAICKKNGKIEVNLVDSFHYIQRYEVQKKKDTLFLEVYLTTLGNFITRDRSLHFYINDNAKYLKVKEKTIKTSDIINCK